MNSHEETEYSEKNLMLGSGRIWTSDLGILGPMHYHCAILRDRLCWSKAENSNLRLSVDDIEPVASQKAQFGKFRLRDPIAHRQIVELGESLYHHKYILVASPFEFSCWVALNFILYIVCCIFWYLFTLEPPLFESIYKMLLGTLI